MSNSFKTLIVGVGNRYRSDDGIGPFIIERLKLQDFNKCELLDAATDGLALLDIIKDYQKVLLIDAINFKALPGTIRVFTPQSTKISIHSDALSTHGFGIAEMLHLMEKLKVKTEMIIIGIQPNSLEFKEGLSSIVSEQVVKIESLIKEHCGN